MRAIVIDDSRAMRMILRRALGELGFVTEEACDGVDALRALNTTDPPDLALLDWNMPNMTGFELLGILRTRSLFDTMKIVMVTTEVEIHQVEKALQAGATEYIMKPFTTQIIREKLEGLGLIGAAA